MSNVADDPTGARRALAENLKTLLAYHKRHKTGKPTSGAGIERACGVSNSTVSRYTLEQASANVSDLSKIAAVYNLHVWQLLCPALNPANPPVVRTATIDQQELEILEAAIKLLSKGVRKPDPPS